MASSKQTKKIITSGKHIIKYASNKRPRFTSENDVEAQDSDNNHDETSQSKNASKSGELNKEIYDCSSNCICIYIFKIKKTKDKRLYVPMHF